LQLPERPKFRSLEGLRGTLALLVCVGHLGLNTIANRVGLTVHFGLSVDVFFALSGFVLCYSNYFGRRTFNLFIVSRFARLYPLHLLTLVAMAIMLPALGSSFSAIEFLQSLAVLHNVGLWPNRLSLNFPSWSISVEIWVSILFFLALQRRTLAVLLPLLLVVVAVPPLLVPTYIQGDAENAFTLVNLGLLRGLSGFSTGVIAYLIFERCGSKLKIPAILLYALLSALAVFFFLDNWPFGLPLAFYVILAAALASLAANDEATALSARPIVFLGTVSYSIYLLHIPVYSALLLAFGEGTVRGPGKAIVLAVIIVASWASYRWIERPAQRIILRLPQLSPKALS
jgi:peptidoglycan/LPS O-acetylase OafA/YrhL